MNFVKIRGKNLICKILERQVRNLRLKNSFIVVAVVGSVGKTSTKLAISKVLSTEKRVRYQEGNYNDRLTVPLVFFGHSSPSLMNVFSWVKIILSNQKQIKNFNFDVVVIELGTDGPGQIKDFQYIYPDISVVTAVTPEHMEFFDSLDDVAKEELSVCSFSRVNIINGDDVAKKYLKDLDYKSYGLNLENNIVAKNTSFNNGQIVEISKNKYEIKLLGNQGAKIALSAYSVAKQLELSEKAIKSGLESLVAFAGRMNLLEGIKDSLIIDDTYNASPDAVIAGLDVLYAMKAKQKIAILGNMNELGKFSEEMHRQIGKYCDDKQLDLVITLGPDAQKFITEEASKKGCEVHAFSSPFEVGDFVAKKLKSGAVIFAKGSQNKVFAEESLKALLANKQDAAKLVRQSKYWLDIKEKQFNRKIES